MCGTTSHRDDAPYRRLPEARRAVEDMVTVFGARNIRATWATVGFLFASNRRELEAHVPTLRPTYARPELNPYVEAIGPDEEHDPEHLAGSLVDLIGASAGQEVGSHTFSHYYCLEPGQSEATFRADLAAAQSIARWRGLELTSLVLPRNQWNPAYTDAVLASGFRCIRGPQRTRGHGARRSGGRNMLRRGARLADTYVGVSPPPTTAVGRGSVAVGPVRRAGQRVLAAFQPRPPAARAAAPGPVALGAAPRGAARPHLPPVVAPPQLLSAPIRELRPARAGPGRVRPVGHQRGHAVVDHGGRRLQGCTNPVGSDG